MLPLGLPLTDLHLARIDELEQLVGERYLGWAVSGFDGHFRVDVLGAGGQVEGYHAPTLHLALGAALRAAGARRAA